MLSKSYISNEMYDLDQPIVTQWGGKIIPRDEKWFLEGRSINFSKLLPYVSASFVFRFKVLMAFRCQINAYMTLYMYYDVIVSLLKFLRSRGCNEINVITCEHVLWWQAALVKADREYVLGSLRRFFLDSADMLNEPLVDAEAATLLARLVIPGGPKGQKVNDPDHGRMTLAERQIFETKARQEFEKNNIHFSEFLALILFNSFGLRTIDFVSFKVLDVHLIMSNGNVVSATIDIPYGKTGQPPRSRMSYGNSVDLKVAELLKLKISKRPPNAPLFELSDSCAPRQTGILEGHMCVSSATVYLMEIIGKLSLGFHLNPYRFRYSVGTEAYRETGSPYITARVLRHSDIQNVIVYVNEIVLAQAHDRVAAEVFKDISEVIGAGVKAKTFSGVVITKQVFKKGDLATVRAREELGNFAPIGGCAGGLRCAQGVPVACYCCLKFRPIKEADHHGMLKATLANYFLFLEKDEKIASSLIPPILGMAQVCYLITTS